MIYNEDCIGGSKKISDKSVDLMVCDPPFGIEESSFHKHYFRDETKVVDGYKESPADYLDFSTKWLTESKRILKDDGSLYVFSGWSNLTKILKAIDEVGLTLINHIIWKFNFGVFTRNKFVSSHYHILYLKKDNKLKPIFNTNCRFGSYETDESGGKLLYKDLEDVWFIKKEYSQDEIKNKNKLPEELIKKIVLYSSDPGDTVCDFFLGNFTTAIVSKKLGRIPIGFEINDNGFQYFMDKLEKIQLGEELKNIRAPILDDKPYNQGLPLSTEEKSKIIEEFEELKVKKWKKKDILAFFIKKYGRGRWSLERILKNDIQ